MIYDLNSLHFSIIFFLIFFFAKSNFIKFFFFVFCILSLNMRNVKRHRKKKKIVSEQKFLFGEFSLRLVRLIQNNFNLIFF